MDLFKSKSKEQQPINKVYDPFEGIRSQLTTFFGDKLGKPADPYTGDFVAPMSDAEKTSQQQLKQYSDSPGTGETFGLVKDEIKKTLTDQYDPSNSPYYQAVKATAMRNQDKALEGVAHKATMGRRYFGGGRVRAQGDVYTDTTNALNETVYGLADKERQRKIDILPQATALDQYESNIPLIKTAANQQYGALPRELEQAYNDAVYEEFLNATREYPINIAQLATGLGAQEPIFTQTQQPAKAKKSPLSFIGDLFNIL